MQTQLLAYVVRLILAHESEADFLAVLMVVGSFMVLIFLIWLKGLKIWTPVAKGTALDSWSGLCSADGGEFQQWDCSSVDQTLFLLNGARFCALHSASSSLLFWSCTEDLQFYEHQLLGSG